jgi:hypothetical protein
MSGPKDMARSSPVAVVLPAATAVIDATNMITGHIEKGINMLL